MLKQFLSLSISLLSVIAASAQGTVTIEGNVNGDTKGFNKIYIYGQGIKSDSTELVNGKFKFSFPYEKGCVPILYTQYDPMVKGGMSPFPAVIDHACHLYLRDVDITKGMSSGTWEGDPSAVAFQSIGRKMSKLQEEVNNTLQPKFPDRNEAWQAAHDSLMKVRTVTLMETFVQAHPDLYASTTALSSYRHRLSTSDLERIHAMLSEKQQATPAGKDISNYLTGVRNSAIGNKVKDFTLPTPDNKTISFASLKGKYILIDFWASWCGPCIASFPHMKEMYKQFKSDQFEIYSISIDKDKASWLTALKKQDLPWLQALDTIDISQHGFAITAVPTTYLISPDGKIILKELGISTDGNSAMEKKLRELFPEKRL